jgi:hypothetical protein
VLHVVRHEGQSQRESVRGHESVDRADWPATSRQGRRDGTEPIRRPLIEGSDLDGLDERAYEAVKLARASCLGAEP